ncbi:FKBP-type peptidyl-prolyl cis-trans isomerase [Shewanella sp. WXL01]|uniref:Peptidyl-prolyl cis-trans isomerase n=1 Tax=Shewanella maritima TaxID=2520507 RepID=A0A411PHC8_9GAMM|nr:MULTISPECIES: FKBP-type peptidyl-prolyl cis-trans isomerase [Shewanella]NKF51923.1 FKBP-type peptidyl-prolyl cis-trans isomerase [Shewanella sp. WXL01]QBF82999.1 FKBP-type peptidyl-prolyl cis-trans isomerase [Shewanella maritima]
MKTLIKNTFKLTCVAALCGSSLFVQANEVDDASYALGASVGKYISSRIYSQVDLGAEVKVDTVIAGVVDALKNETKMTDEEILTHLNARAEVLNAAKEARTAKIAADNLEQGKAFLADNKSKDGVNETATGLQYEVITKGEGKTPLESDIVTVHYKGQLIDGTVFDDSFERDEPNRFPLMTVIEGWKEGLGLMPEGSKYRLTIPAELAYGEKEVGIIPPNSTLIFEVELVKVEEPGSTHHSMGGMGMGGMGSFHK